MTLKRSRTAGGVVISCEQESLAYDKAIEPLLVSLDTQRGALFASSFEYPGRYTRWDIGFCNPPLVLVYRQQLLQIQALNARGEVLTALCLTALRDIEALDILQHAPGLIDIKIKPSPLVFSEEERSHQPSVFTVIRALLAFFQLPDDPCPGLYGSFGYDLIHQFESLTPALERDVLQRDMVLYLPDEIYLVNHAREEASIRRYDFEYKERSTKNIPREVHAQPYESGKTPSADCDHAPGEYASLVKEAKNRFACGDLFEVVLSQTFFAHTGEKPSELFRHMREVNPSPYGFLMNLGEQEFLVGASPEMYVRVQGRRVETCPISGTIARGADPIEDALNIQQLLNSSKEASELTMCTDVDRNDKSRICEAGSVRVLGRRQIEMYSRLIHTVDHVEGTLRAGFDAVDAFLTHMWVVTVTGAPKLWAMNFIENHEKSPRKWYGGAVGWFGFNGDLNTGLVLRTIRLKNGLAEVRVGATLLYDSEPLAEEQETRLKASAFLDIIHRVKKNQTPHGSLPLTGVGKRVLLVDHQDSFVHTLGNYLRQTGAYVVTMRHDHVSKSLQTGEFDLVVLSPGPGRPADFKVMATIDSVLARHIPLFGVCLGLQGIVEYFGGVLDVLPYPMHGKASEIIVKKETALFKGMGGSFTAGRYHSLYARMEQLPASLQVTAMSQDGIIMAVSHKSLPIEAVQFHPETILSLTHQAGMRLITNLMRSIHEPAQ